MTVRRVGVVGAGTMGSGIAQAFAQHGFDVSLHDESPAALTRAQATIQKSLAKFVEKGTMTADARDLTLAAIRVGQSLDATAACDIVIEAIVEDLAAKRKVFARLSALAPTAVLASNTSSVSITAIAEASSSPDRVAGMHFMNPVPLMPLVEIIRGGQTSDETMATIRHLTTALGKTGIESADRPGFIANRVLMPLINEAAFALMEGVGSAQGIDTVFTLGMRHPMGPLTLADFIGLDVCVAILDVMHEGLRDEKYRACPLLRDHVAAGRLGRKTGAGFYTYDVSR